MKALFSGLMLSIAALAVFSTDASAACANGDQKILREYSNSGRDGREENVTYVCVAGIWRKNGIVPQYPAACANGATKQIKEYQTKGNHEIEVPVTYVCVSGVWRKNGKIPQILVCKEGSVSYTTVDKGNGREINVATVCVNGKYVRK